MTRALREGLDVALASAEDANEETLQCCWASLLASPAIATSYSHKVTEQAFAGSFVVRLAVSLQARFDRHFVRALMWSQHQLEELAERRFIAAGLTQ